MPNIKELSKEVKGLRQLITQYKSDFDQYKEDQLGLTSRLTAHLDMIKLKELQKKKTSAKLKMFEEKLTEQAEQLSTLIEQMNDKLLQYKCECGKVNRVGEKFLLKRRASLNCQQMNPGVIQRPAMIPSDAPADSGVSMIVQAQETQYLSTMEYTTEKGASPNLSPKNSHKVCQTDEAEPVPLSPISAGGGGSRVAYTVPMLAYQNQRIRGYEDVGVVEFLKNDGSIIFNPNDVCKPWKDEYWRFMTKGDSNSIMRSRFILLPITMGGIIVEAVIQGANTEEFCLGLYASGIEYNWQLRTFPETVYVRARIKERQQNYNDSGQYKFTLKKADSFTIPMNVYVKFGNCHRSRLPEIVLEFQDNYLNH